MRIRTAGLALVLMLGGCGEDTSAPGVAVLVGQLGVAGEFPARLIGLHVAAELQFGCTSVGTDEPVELGPDGRFVFEGRFRPSGLALGGGQKARVLGQVIADEVSSLCRLTAERFSQVGVGEWIACGWTIAPETGGSSGDSDSAAIIEAAREFSAAYAALSP